MILVKWNLKDRTLSFSGHSACELVCSAVSVLTGTLFVEYGALEAPKSGKFEYQSVDSMDESAVEFVCKALILLEIKYPGHIDFVEVA